MQLSQTGGNSIREVESQRWEWYMAWHGWIPRDKHGIYSQMEVRALKEEGRAVMVEDEL